MLKSPTNRRDVVYSDKDHCIAVYGNAILSYSAEPPNPRYLTAWVGAMDRLTGRSPRPLAVLTIIDSRARAPDETSKKAIRSAVSRHCNNICAFAYVVEGHGFGAAAVRSALSLISLAARYPFPQKVFANVPAATPWAVAKIPDEPARDITVARIISVVEAMRYQVKQLAAVG
jgi:hypothetical protein